MKKQKNIGIACLLLFIVFLFFIWATLIYDENTQRLKQLCKDKGYTKLTDSKKVNYDYYYPNYKIECDDKVLNTDIICKQDCTDDKWGECVLDIEQTCRFKE